MPMQYSQFVESLNDQLREALERIEFAKFWLPSGLRKPKTNIYVRDGIHLNNLGNKTLYKSYRGAI